MSKSINTLVVAALTVAATFQQRVADVRAALPRATLADKKALFNALRPGVAAYYGIELDPPKSTGRVVFPADHANTEAAKKALQRLVRAVQGDVVHQKAEAPAMRFSAGQKAAAAALLEACGGDMARVRAVLKAVQG